MNRAVIRCLLIGAAAAALGAGCSMHDRPQYPAGGPERYQFRVQRIELRDLECPLYCVKSGRQVTVHLSYVNENPTTPENSPFDWLRIFDPRGASWETKLLMIYLGHAAIEYMNTGATPPNIRVEKVETVKAGRPIDGPPQWWFCPDYFSPRASAQPGGCSLDWCQNTLALRINNTDIMEILPNKMTTVRHWNTMTPGSYPQWYEAVDSRLAVNRILGGGDGPVSAGLRR